MPRDIHEIRDPIHVFVRLDSHEREVRTRAFSKNSIAESNEKCYFTRMTLTHAREYIDRLAAGGRHDFSSRDAQKALGVTPAAVKMALNRLAKRGLIASPARGFYVIVPPEYLASVLAGGTVYPGADAAARPYVATTAGSLMLAARFMKSNMKLKMTSELARRRRGARAVSGNRQPLGSIRKNAKAS
jgi:hypothetical protein